MKLQKVAAGLSASAVIAASLKHLELDDPGNKLAILDRITMCVILTSCIWRLLQATLGLPSTRRKGHWRAHSVFAIAAYALQIWHVAAYSIWKARSKMWIKCFSSNTQPLMEIFLAVLAQGQLYQQRILPVWATLVMATIHSTLLATVAAQHLGTAFLRHLLRSSMCTTVVPFLTHIAALRCAACTTESTGTVGKQQASIEYEQLGCTARISKEQPVTQPEKPSPLPKSVDGTCQQMPLEACQAMQHNLHAAPIVYSSRLASRCSQMSIKMHTNTDMKDLPHDLADQLQASLSNIYGASFRLSNLAIRQGCILIRADMFDMKQSEADDNGLSQHSHSILSDVAHSLLPTLQQLFSSETEDMFSKQRVRFQHGDVVLNYFWNRSSVEWELASQQAWMEAKPSARLGLVRIAKLQSDLIKGSGNTAGVSDPAVMEGDNKTTVTGKAASSLAVSVAKGGSNNNIIDNNTGSNSNNLKKTSNTAKHTTPLFIEMKVLTASGFNILGWSRPTAKHTDMEPLYDNVIASSTMCTWSNDSLQVLACSYGEYYETEVINMQGLEPNSPTDNRDITVTVRVDMPSDGCHHHVGQKPPCIQLLTLELWMNELLINSSTAILPRTSTVKAGKTISNSVNVQIPCWWWGSRPATATGAVAELVALTDNTASDADTDVDAQYTDLFHDVSMWLTGVRHFAQSPQGNCHLAMQPAAVAAARLTTPALSAQELLEVGSDLVAYAQQSGMHQLSAMLQQQAQLVKRHATTQQPCQGAKQCVTATGTFLQRLKTSACGSSCPMCEQYYRQRLSRHLARAQMLYMAFSITIAAVGIQRGRDRGLNHFLMMIGWAIPQLFCGYHHLRYMSKPAGTGARDCSRVCAFSFLSAVVNWSGMITGLIVPPTFVLQVYQSWLSIPVNLTLAMFEQLPSAIVLPAPLVTAAAFVIATCQSLMGVGMGHGLIKLCFNVAVTVVTRLVADMHLRAMLMKPISNH